MASLIRILTTLLIAVGFTAPTMAQSDLGNWPTQRPIKMIAVFPPGGSVDQVARILAPVLQAELKQNIVVEHWWRLGGHWYHCCSTSTGRRLYLWASV